MSSILDHLELVLIRPIKVADGKPKISKDKSVLARVELNVDGVLFPTTQYYWIPRFLIQKNNYLSTNWKEGAKMLREIREKIIDGEKGCFQVIPYENDSGAISDYIRETEKAVQVRCKDSEGIVYEMWVPKSLLVNNIIPSWFVDKMKDERDDKGNLRITRVTPERVSDIPKKKDGSILDYGKTDTTNNDDDEDIDWDALDREFFDEDLDGDINDLIAGIEDDENS